MLDFKIKARKSGPPARMLASAKAMLKAQGLPEEFAGIIATYAPTSEALEPLMKAAQICADHDKGDEGARALELTLKNLEANPYPAGTLAQQAEMMAKAVLDTDIHPSFSRAHVRQDWDSPENTRAKMVDGFMSVIDRSHKPTIGAEYAGLRLSDFAEMSARNAGLRPMNRDEAVRFVMAAHSTSDFPLILENSMHKVIARRMAQRAPDILRAASKRSNENYRASRTLTLSQLKTVTEVAEGGEIEYSTFEEKGEANPVLRDFAGAFNVTNRVLVNDDAGFFDGAATRMVEACIAVQRNVLLEPLLKNSGAGQTMADGQPLFDASHGNLAATGAELSVESLSVARTAMRKQKGLVGEILALEPWGLVVPAELETAAQKVLAELQATKLAEVNPFSGKLELIVEPGLTSAIGWYLIANPEAYEGLVWATLEGMDSPRVQSREGWETLGMQFRVTWALDAAFTEHATWYHNPGPSEE